MNKIMVLRAEPNKQPFAKIVENKLHALQKEVEGNIECVDLGSGCVLVCNEEGKLNGMQPNRQIGNDLVCGAFIICKGTEDGAFVSLDDEEIAEYKTMFWG